MSAVLHPAPAVAAQTVPYKINFQGRLSDNAGNALTDGLYNIKFRLWTLGSGGSNVWEGDRVRGTSDYRVQVTNGLFNIQFGDTTLGDPALSPSLFSNGTYPLYLEVELPTPATATCATNGCAVFTEGAMTPRQALASTPYAFSADTLDGLDSAAFGQLAAANTFTGANLFAPSTAATVALTVKATTAGGTNALEVFDSANTRQAYFDANGKLNVAQTIQPTTNNAVDLGTSGTAFKSGYFGTSVLSPSFTGAGAVTLSSGGSGDLTLDSATGTLVIAASDTTLKRTAAGTYTLDLNDAGATVLAVTNSAAGAASLTVEGNLTVGAFAAATSTPVCSSSGVLATCNANPSGVTLQQAYAAGATISTTGNDVAFTLNGGQNFTVTTATNTAGFTSILRADGAGTADPAQLLLVKNLDVDRAQPIGIKVDAANTNGKITTALDVSSANIINAISLGANAITGNYFNLSNQGDVTAAFIQLDGTTTTASNQNNTSTSLPLTSAANFDIGNYVQITSTDCGGTGISPCYAKITNKVTNTLTITPALKWANGSNVLEFHIPELGGTDLTQTLTNRYGRGYFIAGVATGNGTTYYNEDSITSSLATFNLLTSATTLNIGGAATNLTLGGASSTVNVAGNLSTTGSGAITSASTVTGTTLNGTTGINTGAGAGTQRLDASGNLVNIGNITQTGTYLLQNSSDSSAAFRILTAGGTPRTLLNVSTSSTEASFDANLIVQSSVVLPTITSVSFGSNSAGTLSGAPGTNYFYRISAIVGTETAASGEVWISSAAFTPLSAPAAPTTAAGASGGISGTYQYKYTYITANGETTPSPASAGVTVSNKKINVTIANGPTGTTGKKIYRTTAGPGTTYLLLTTIADNTTTAYVDSTADAGLGLAAPSANTATTNLNSVSIAFPAFPSATSYRIYRGAASLGVDHYQTTASSPFTDTGATGTAATPIEPTAGRVGIGTASPGYALDVAGNISASNAFIQNGNVGQTTSCGTGNTLSGMTISGGIVTSVGACAAIGGGSASATLQSAYDNSSIPQIALSSTGGALTVADTAAGLGANLFVVEDNAGATSYLAVSATGLSVTGSGSFSAGVTIDTGQTYKINGTQITTAALSDASSITMQGNAFNGTSQLVQTTAGGALPTISGTNLTSLNPTNLATGSGAVSIGSGAATGLTLNAANGTLIFGSNTTTLQRAASTLSIDLATAATSTLTITNSNASNIANLSVEGGITIGSGKAVTVGATAGVDRTCTGGEMLDGILTAGGIVIGGTCAAPTGGGGANTALSNLATTTINAALTPDATANNRDLGTVSSLWRTAYIGTSIQAPVLQAAAATALTVTGNAASTWSTSAGQLTIQSGSGTVSLGSSTTLTANGALSIDSNTTNALNLGTTASAHTVTIGNTTGATTVTIDTGTGGLNLADNATAKTIDIGGVTTGGTDIINIGTNATGADDINIGSTNAASSVTLNGGALSTTNNIGVIIGGGANLTDTSQVNLILDSSNTFAEAANTCSTTGPVNLGAIYYNTSSNAIRACINGSWEDLMSTAGMGILTFGVVADSGSNPGDLGSITSAGVNGPCKVSWNTATSVKVAPCTAYSGGRKVTVPSIVTITLGSQGNNNWYHICFGSAGTPGAPTLWPAAGLGGTEAANLPTFSSSAPILCLADVKTAANAIANIYDVRTFTNSQKAFATINAVTGILGGVVSQSATANVVQLTSAAAQVNTRGVIVAAAGSAAANNTINLIIATQGMQPVKAAGTSALNGIVQSTNVGYTSTVVNTTPTANIYGNMGVAQRTIDTLCTATTNCQFSQLVDLRFR